MPNAQDQAQVLKNEKAIPKLASAECGTPIVSRPRHKPLIFYPSYGSDDMVFARSDDPVCTLLPALPSKTKGPALFVGVMGPSCISMSVVGVRNADSLDSSVPKRGWVGVMGRRNCADPGVDLEADRSAARENGGEIRRAPRRVSRPGAEIASFVESDGVVTEGIE